MKISVCMATFNGAKYIKQQLQSILMQLSEEDEVIVSDDSSSDNTLEIVASFNDKRIKLFPNNQFSSSIYNFEFALKQAKGDYIFLSDQDDVWLEGKVLKTINELQHVDMLVSDCSIVDEQFNIKIKSYFEHTNAGNGLLKNLLVNTYSGCCMAFKKKLLKKVLPFPENLPTHDMWIGFVAELFFKIKFIKDPLILHRIHGNNSSTMSEKSKSSTWQKILFRWNLIKNIPILIVR